MVSRGPAHLVSRSSRVQDDELRRDILAVAVPGGSHSPPTGDGLDRDAILSRPTLLRRIAARAAAHVRPGTDRLVTGERDAALGAALALHTGLPLALLNPTSGGEADPPRGELHRLERVVLLACVGTDLPALHASSTARGVSVTAAVSVLGRVEASEHRAGGNAPSVTDLDFAETTLFHTTHAIGDRG